MALISRYRALLTLFLYATASHQSESLASAAAFVPLLSRLQPKTTHHPPKKWPLSLLVRKALTNDEISRYSRHLVLNSVGVKGQLALKNASVLVIGAGGLGSPCLLYLAAAGVGHIGIVDGDTVDESNLQRQIIHSTSTVGVSKCQSAAERIHHINPHVKVRLYEQEFTSETALSIVQGGFSPDGNRHYDVVVDGSDNFPTKYLIKYVNLARALSPALFCGKP